MCTDFLNIIITASLLTTSLSQAPHAPSHGNAFQALTCSLLLSQPLLPFCFLHLSTHYNGLRKMSMRGQMFPFSFQILTSQTPAASQGKCTSHCSSAWCWDTLSELALALTDPNRCSCIIPANTLHRFKTRFVWPQCTVPNTAVSH